MRFIGHDLHMENCAGELRVAVCYGAAESVGVAG